MQYLKADIYAHSLLFHSENSITSFHISKTDVGY
jgi:hypothetical protein